MTDTNEKPPHGLPGIRGTDHIGFTVPDIEQAHAFFTEILGCQYIYSLGPFPRDRDLLINRLHVSAEAEMKEIRFYRCFNGSNFEVFEYAAPDQVRTPPRNSDVGGHHIALYVDDLDAAVAYLQDHGVRVQMPVTESQGASAGQSWVYFLAPWGMQFELVSFPHGKAYEKHASQLLWDPVNGGHPVKGPLKQA